MSLPDDVDARLARRHAKHSRHDILLVRAMRLSSA